MIRKINKAIFLDRDGVINRAIIKDHKPYAPRSMSRFKIYKDVELFNKFKNRKIRKELIKKFHKKISNSLKIDKIYACYHDDEDKCSCRKPGIKFFLDAKKKFNLSLERSYFIGDRWKDMKAGNKAKCVNIFLDRNYKESKEHNFDFSYSCNNLKSAIKYIQERDKI